MSVSRPAGAWLVFFAVVAATFGLPSHGLDMAVTRWVQRAAPAPDVSAAYFVFLGNAEVLIPAVATAGLIVWRRDPAWSTAAWTLGAGLLAVSVLAVVLKRFVPHAGPPAEFERRAAYLHPGVSLGQPWSFPSGHTARLTYFSAHALRRRPWIAVVLILAMMAALVYLGDHWTTDVLGGLSFGWACAVTARSLAANRPRSARGRSSRGR